MDYTQRAGIDQAGGGFRFRLFLRRRRWFPAGLRFRGDLNGERIGQPAQYRGFNGGEDFPGGLFLHNGRNTEGGGASHIPNARQRPADRVGLVGGAIYTKTPILAVSIAVLYYHCLRVEFSNVRQIPGGPVPIRRGRRRPPGSIDPTTGGVRVPIDPTGRPVPGSTC